MILLSIHTLSIVKGTQEALFLFLWWCNEGQTGSAGNGQVSQPLSAS